MKKKTLGILILLTVIAGIYPIFYRMADDYQKNNFLVGPMLGVQITYFILFGFGINLWFRLKEKASYLCLLFSLINIGLSYYLFWHNNITFTIIPLYTILFANVLLFDFIFVLISEKKPDIKVDDTK